MTAADLLAQRRALVADLRQCGSDRLERATIEAQIKILDGQIRHRVEPHGADCYCENCVGIGPRGRMRRRMEDK